ncbi:ATP-binding protein, partial [Rhizobium ruizarguesonis]
RTTGGRGPRSSSISASAAFSRQAMISSVSRIEVSAFEQAGKVVLTVRDNGPGVPAAIAERIFDPFFTTKGVGKGLGL